jgi:predicted dehydrogenase
VSNQAFEPVKIGIVGVGSFGRLHALTLAGMAEAELVAMVGRNQNRLDAMQQELPGVKTWTNLDAAINESSAEAWVIASSTASHVDLAAKLLQADKFILLEKPIAETLQSARELEPYITDDSSNFMMGHILLFSSEFRALLAEVRARSPIIFMNSVRHRPMTTADHYPNETPLSLLMVHDLYLVYTLMNAAIPQHFSAQVHRRADGGCDLAVAELKFMDGAIASCCASFLTPAGMSPDGFDRLEVFGKGWSARMLANPRPVQVWDDKARWPMALEILEGPDAPSGMLAEELRCFCRVVRGVNRVPLGARFADALKVQEWLEKLEQSAHLGV